jgi:hypothetical protein
VRRVYSEHGAHYHQLVIRIVVLLNMNSMGSQVGQAASPVQNPRIAAIMQGQAQAPSTVTGPTPQQPGGYPAAQEKFDKPIELMARGCQQLATMLRKDGDNTTANAFDRIAVEIRKLGQRREDQFQKIAEAKQALTATMSGGSPQ